MLELFRNYWPALALILMALAGIALVRLLSSRETLPYAKRKRLVTKSELKFYRYLHDAVDGDWTIFAMVRVADLLRVERGNKKYRSWLNKILSKHIDFVLCDKDNLNVVLGIELDDPSHNLPSRKKRDRFINHAFEDAGLPLLRVETDSSYDASWLRSEIDEAIAG